ncbi:MAG TPA: hypothetical protein VLX85_08255 [Stellaceae bacterium]|nr:hypothetical protein [Stellaceae bacterium]
MANRPFEILSAAHPESDMRAFLESAGYILGAASCCSEIDRPRIIVAAHRIREIVRAEKRDALDVNDAFSEGITAGTKAMGEGELDPAEADTALAALERLMGR